MKYNEKQWKAATHFSTGDCEEPDLCDSVEIALLAYIEEHGIEEADDIEVWAWAPVTEEAKDSWVLNEALHAAETLDENLLDQYNKELTDEQVEDLQAKLNVVMRAFVGEHLKTTLEPVCERIYRREEILELLKLTENNECSSCQGTGIGDPHADTRCSSCGGSGVNKGKPEYDGPD